MQIQRQTAAEIHGYAQGRAADILPRIQTRIVGQERMRAHPNRVFLRTQFMIFHLHARIRHGAGRMATHRRDEAVGRLRPLQDNIRSFQTDIRHEPPVQETGLGRQHPFRHVPPPFPQKRDAAPAHNRIGIAAGHDHTFETAFRHFDGARRLLAVMRTRLQADIQSRFRE